MTFDLVAKPESSTGCDLTEQRPSPDEDEHTARLKNWPRQGRPQPYINKLHKPP